MKTTRAYDKLDYQQLGIFLISTQINEVTFCLDLPPHIRLHMVVNNSLLETSSIPNHMGCYQILDSTY